MSSQPPGNLCPCYSGNELACRIHGPLAQQREEYMETPQVNPNQRVFKALVTSAMTQIAYEATSRIFSAQDTVNKLRRTAKAFQEMEWADGTGPALVIDLEVLEQAESLLFDAIETFARSMEPPEEVLDEMHLTSEDKQHLFSEIMGGRNDIAERRRRAFEDAEDVPLIQRDDV